MKGGSLAGTRRAAFFPVSRGRAEIRQNAIPQCRTGPSACCVGPRAAGSWAITKTMERSLDQRRVEIDGQIRIRRTKGTINSARVLARPSPGFRTSRAEPGVSFEFKWVKTLRRRDYDSWLISALRMASHSNGTRLRHSRRQKLAHRRRSWIHVPTCVQQGQTVA